MEVYAIAGKITVDSADADAFYSDAMEDGWIMMS